MFVHVLLLCVLHTPSNVLLITANNVLTFKHNHPLNLSICKATYDNFYLFAQLASLSPQDIDTTTKGSGQDTLRGE